MRRAASLLTRSSLAAAPLQPAQPASVAKRATIPAWRCRHCASDSLRASKALATKASASSCVAPLTRAFRSGPPGAVRFERWMPSAAHGFTAPRPSTASWSRRPTFVTRRRISRAQWAGPMRPIDPPSGL
jgi:hypothetical protein